MTSNVSELLPVKHRRRYNPEGNHPAQVVK